MSLDEYAQSAREINGTFKKKVNVKDLEAYMRANWGKLTLQQVADHFGISIITAKRYAKQFNLVRVRESSLLQDNQREIKTGILTVIGNRTIHESGVKASMQ